MTSSTHLSKTRLLDAALQVIRAKGYCATTVDDICAAAGVTKGSFFHHFKGKEDLAVTAADYWGETTSAFFAAAPYHAHADALDRVLGYIDFRRDILQGDPAQFTCLVGTMVQETFDSAPTIRAACERCISNHAATLVPDMAQAMAERGMDETGTGWSAESLALHTQAVLQGAFILAKAKGEGGAALAAQSVNHLRRYVELLFGPQRGAKNT